MSLELHNPIQYVKGVGPRLASLLTRKNVVTIFDALNFLPRTYEDRRRFTPIVELIPGAKQTSLGVIHSVRVIPLRNRKLRILECLVADATGSLYLKWFRFHEKTMRSILKPGMNIIFSGEVQEFRFRKQVLHPDFEIYSDEEKKDFLHFGRIVPIYSETEGLYQKTIRKILKHVVDSYVSRVVDPLPETMKTKHELMVLAEAYKQIHFPDEKAEIQTLLSGESLARKRLVFDEFFYLELGLALKKSKIKKKQSEAFTIDEGFIEKFAATLPFQLTQAQNRATSEIFTDLKKTSPMNRLVQGDVGSGKTVVAMAAALAAYQNGFQVAVMAPTEILAQQHFFNFKQILSSFDKANSKISHSLRLLVSALKDKEKKAVYREIEQGIAKVIIGTHALIQEDVHFSKLGLVIIDEQHRFGVEQRMSLTQKGKEPHVLVMTATPIPRTLALTAYGELDFSIIDEMPSGRKPIQTKIIVEGKKTEVFSLMNRELKLGRQVYYIFPLIEESEKSDLKDATEGAKQLAGVFSSYKVALLHGKMKQEEKDRIMTEFKANKIKILVSTTVVEVGVDVPNASVMVVEHAERFGLSQLHQLRGRVGRGEHASYCLLITSLRNWDEEKDSVRRLKIMEETTNGFLIAEEDLKIRGPGEFLGTRQAGFIGFKLANLISDHKILKEARLAAFNVIHEDPNLEKGEHLLIKKSLLENWRGRMQYLEV